MRHSQMNLVLFGLLVASGPAWGNVTVTISDADGDPCSATVSPASSLSILIQLDAEESLTAGQMRVLAGDPDVFTLNSILYDGLLWSNDPADLFDPTPESLNAGNLNTSSVIGTLALNLSQGTGIGTLPFAAIQVLISAEAAPGTYTLNITDAVFGDTSFDDVPGIAGTPYQINVIPEPAGLVLTLAVPSLLLRRRRRTA